MRYQVLGGLAVDDGGRAVDLGGHKQRTVLAVLLLEAGRPVSPDRLVDLVWGDAAPSSAETSLQVHVSNLRRALEPGRKPRAAPTVLVTRPAGYALLAERDDIDAARFEDRAAAGHAALLGGDAPTARDELDAALAEWTGAPLPEWAGTAWFDATTARLTEVHAQALEDRFEAGLALGEHAALVPRIEAAVTEEPYRERLRAQLALALYRSGRQREALTSLQDARRVLDEEVGIEPGAELRRLEGEVLAQSPTLDLAPAGSAPVAPAGPAPVAPAAVPPPVAAPARAPDPIFVGRDGELRALLDAAAGAAAGAGRPVVISGEPGIGKTRLVEELVARVPDAVVAWGRCPESAAQAVYWPCTQIARQLDAAGVVPPELAPVVLEGRVPSTGDPVADRHALHVAAAELVHAPDRPLVLVVDDLQWADPGSLRMIEFMAGELRASRGLLVVTTRPVTPDAPAPLIDCLGELARQPGALRLDLAGLDADEVATWIDRRTGGTGDPAVAGVVHGRTAGNPFFVGEVVELLAGDGRLTDADAAQQASVVPAAVQDVIRRRVSRLPAGSQQLLTTASTIGRGFDVDVLAGVAGATALDVLEALEAPLDAGLVEGTDIPGRFQFAHALVADTLAAELNAARRARLHATTAGVIATVRAGDLTPHLAALAYHAFEGAAAGTAEQAYEWAVAAARHATERTAHEDAAAHWGQAVRAVELARPGDRAARVDAMIEQALAHLRLDAITEAYTVLGEAIDLALSMGDDERLARAAASMHTDGLWPAGEVALTSGDAVASLQRALAAMPAEPSAARALAVGALAENGYWLLPVEELDATSTDAVDLARALGDPLLVARSLHKRGQALWRTATFEARRDAAEEALRIIDAERAPPRLRVAALFHAASASWEGGDVPAVEDRVGDALATARSLGSPGMIAQLAFFQASLHTFRGELAEADELIDEGYEIYRRTRRWAADPFRAGFKTANWIDAGRTEDILEVAPLLLEGAYGPFFGECVLFALTELGELERAEEIADGRVPPLIDSWLHLGVLGAATHSRVTLGDEATTRMLLDHLRPCAGRLAATGTGASFGDIDLAIARAEHLLGDDEAALRHLERSITVLTRADAVPWLVRAHLLRAELTGDEENRREAERLLGTRSLPLLQRRLEGAIRP